jgi:hypothetical protein
MSHQDGRCASSAETIIVTSSSGNLPSTSVPSGIRLVVIRGSVTGNITWTLSTSQMTIVGQNTGTLTGPGSAATTQTGTVHAIGGDLYVRNLSITAGSPGLWAESGAVVRLSHVNVSDNTAGGILLDGAGFDIQNTTVNNNGPNSYNFIFGGIFVQNATTPKSLALSTITGNGQVGVACSSGTTIVPATTSVLVSGSAGGIDVGTSCGGITLCTTASTTCGVQP